MTEEHDPLDEAIGRIPLCDSHEHMARERVFIEDCTDILTALFDHYPESDLWSARAPDAAMERLLDRQDSDIAGRFTGIEAAWARIQSTGYGEAVRLAAEAVYGIEELSGASLAAAQPLHEALLKEGERLRLLRDMAGLDHVQIDRQKQQCPPDRYGPEFFLADLGVKPFCGCRQIAETVQREAGMELTDLASYRRAIETIFERNASQAIALKSPHAYERTLRWEKRTDTEAERALEVYCRAPAEFDDKPERLVLGDWGWARCVELAIEHNLPFKLHTGYYAGTNSMRMERIRPSLLCDIVIAYPECRFVLMHASFPYGNELVAMTKHFTNVYADLCWAWSMDPFGTADLVRHFIHTAPANKLFAFGGDTNWPIMPVGYARQARKWLGRALSAEVREGFIDEARAVDLANMFMCGNQYSCFDVDGRRRALRKIVEAGGRLLEERPEE